MSSPSSKQLITISTFDRDMSQTLERIFCANPKAAYLCLKEEIDEAISRVLNGSSYIMGEEVKSFEESFASYVGCDYGIGLNSGTDALHFALRGLNIGKNDEVITVSHTSVATISAIEMAGATPVLVDIEPDWLTIDPAAVLDAIGSRTRAIIVVHLYGQAANLSALSEICLRHEIELLEDCAQSHGSLWAGEKTGSIGTVGCFSFYPTKNLGAIGDGGIVVTNNNDLAGHINMLRQYGWDQPQHSVFPGWNSRLDSLQAAILGVKLKYLDEMNAKRREIARCYSQGFSGLPVRLPGERPGSQHSFHLYVVQLENAKIRNQLREFLAQHEIFASIHYPIPVHLQPAYSRRVKFYSMRVTESICNKILSLPIYPELEQQQQQRIIACIRSFFGDPNQ